MKILFCLVTSVILIGGVAKSQEKSNTEGVWFLCEFAHSKIPPPDGCRMLDDDGFMVRDGILYHVKVQDSREKWCRGGRLGNCLLQDLTPITANIKKIGPIQLINDRIIVSLLGCSQVYELLLHQAYMELRPTENRCYWTPDKWYFLARYLGSINFIGD